MLFEVITEKTYTRTETSIQLVEAESKEEAIQKAAELPTWMSHARQTPKSHMPWKTYQVQQRT